MKRVYKYLLDFRRDVTHDIPAGGRVVKVDLDTREPELAVWVEVDADEIGRERWCFAIHGTGGNVPDFKKHVGSVRVGEYMWHVYRERRDV